MTTMAVVAFFGLGSVCWAAARVEEQCGAGGDFVLHGSDGHCGLGEWEGLGQLQGMLKHQQERQRGEP